EGLLDAARDRLDRHEDAALGGELGHQPRIRRVDPAHLRRVVVREPAVVGKLLRDVLVDAVADRRAGDGDRSDEDEGQADDSAEEADPAPTPPRLRTPWRRRLGVAGGRGGAGRPTVTAGLGRAGAGAAAGGSGAAAGEGHV